MSELRPFRQRHAAVGEPVPSEALESQLDSFPVETALPVAVPAGPGGRPDDPRLSFRSEQEDPQRATASPGKTASAGPAAARWRWPAMVAVAGIAASAVTAAIVSGRLTPSPRAPQAPALAAVTIASSPEGADVAINQVPRGRTPLKVSLAAGAYEMDVTLGDRTRRVPLTVEAGAVMSQYVELAPIDTPPSTGRLDITADTPGAQVSLDGEPRGVTPLTLADVPPGRHRVAVSSGLAQVVRAVEVTPGSTTSVMAALAAPAGVSAGWITVSAPFELQIYEDGALIGTTDADRLMVSAGRHSFELVNRAFEFSTRQTVEVQAGRTAQLAVAVPNGSLSVNALPWAEVELDGRSLGVTPLANVAVPIGRHEIVWRHPQLGERRRTVEVTAASAVRIGMDLTR